MKLTLEQIGEATCHLLKEKTGKQWKHQLFKDHPDGVGAIMIDSGESTAVLFYWQDTGRWSAQTYGGNKQSNSVPSPVEAYESLKRGIQMQIVSLNTLLSTI
ncbi:hypothetical protein BRM13314_00201 [Salmonella phage BRM 13314]|nr:hypothetical protein BRM13313_00203 [Salmonella phage BRM 13313]URQ08825.1 hypothetical protein BRM13312_00199 [Salmonella phage BRM 13312]URQ09126.1 hypothetical protein BRM13314_00201 [Salmonella phage BRM 13314]